MFLQLIDYSFDSVTHPWQQVFGYFFSLSVPCTTALTLRGACCVFPFFYRGINYTQCTAHDHDRPWCAITSGNNYDWDNCYSKKRVLTELNLCITKEYYRI